MKDLIAMAKQAGASTYTNRHYPERTVCAFGPEALQAFADLIRADAFRDGYEKGMAGFMEAVNLEREQCAALGPMIGQALSETYGDGAECINTAEAYSEAIRARTTT
jgi:hypothetical protein